MARIRNIAPRLATIAPLMARNQSAERDGALEYRAWYKTARWQRLRLAAIWNDVARCAMCGAQIRDAAAVVQAAWAIGVAEPSGQWACAFRGALRSSNLTLVADHITPHRGDEFLFWDAGNLQCLCKPCHDRHKQRQERRGQR